MQTNIPHQLGAVEGFWNITEVIEQQALLRPAALAVILPQRLLSYRELVTAVHGVARKLLERGVQQRQLIGVSMGQTALHVVTLLAIARIGAVAVPIHHLLPPDRRVLAARRFAVSVVVSGRPEMQLEGWPFIHLNDVDAGARVPPPPASRTRADHPCWMSLSSGTTGDPKGVLRSHGYLLDRALKSTYVCVPQSRILPMDINFSVGVRPFTQALIHGGTVVLSPDMSPANLAHMARAHAVTHWLISPALAADILAMLDDDDIHFPSLTYLQMVGGTPNQRLLEGLFRRFSPNVYLDYGTSEIGSVCFATPDILRRAPASVGRVAPWVQLELVDQEDRPVAVGQSGRIRLRFDRMFKEYYLDATLTSGRFRHGWYYPNDRARFDAEGLLYIEGREDDLLNVGGAKVFCHDVESVMETHPAVREAATFVLAEPTGRDRLAVAVIATSAVSENELLSWLEQKLGPSRPEKLFFVTEFARTATGKVLRRRLTETYSGQAI